MDLYDLVAKSEFSLEGRRPEAGGKVRNYSKYGHKQKYTPNSEQTYNAQRQDGLVPTLDQTVPSVTGLDIEDNRASIANGGTGGPKNDYTTVYPSANVTGPLGAAAKNFTYQGIEYTYPKAPGQEPEGYYKYMKDKFGAK